MRRLLLGALFFSALPLLGGGRLGGGSLGPGSLEEGRLTGGSLTPRGAGDPAPLFDLGDPTEENGLAGLTAAITVNGVDLTPVFRYLGSDTTTASWAADGYGDDLAATGSGDPTIGAGTPLPDDPGWVDFAATGKSFGEASDNDGAIADGDFLIEAVFKTGDGTQSEDYIVGRYQSSTNPYWLLYTKSNATQMGWISSDGVVAETGTWASALYPETWYHVIFIWDRSASARMYINGRNASTGAVTTPSTGTLNRSATAFQVGSFGSSTATHSGKIALVQAWHNGTAFLNTAAQDDWAFKRHARMAGGAFVDVDGAEIAYDTWDRNSRAYLRVCDSTTDTVTAYAVGDDWIRGERFCGKDWSDPTQATEHTGVLVESDYSNLILQSADLSTTWTTVNATIDTDQGTDLEGETTADDVDGSGAGEHGVSQAVTLTAIEHTLSVYAEAGNQDHAYLTDDTVTDAWAYFDLLTCEVTSNGVGAVPMVEDMGGGLCRVGIGFVGTAASHTLRMLCAEADGDKDYTGAAGDCTFSWAQLSNVMYMASYVHTTTTSQSQLADDWVVYVTPDQAISEHTWVFDAYFPDEGHNNADRNIWHWSDDGNASKIWQGYLDFLGGRVATATQFYDGTTNLSFFDRLPTPGNGEQHIVRWIADVPNTTPTICLDGECIDGSGLNSAANGMNKLVIGQGRLLNNGPFANFFRIRLYDGVYE